MAWVDLLELAEVLLLLWLCVFLVLFGTIRRGYKRFLVTTSSLVVLAGQVVRRNDLVRQFRQHSPRNHMDPASQEPDERRSSCPGRRDWFWVARHWCW